MDATLFRVAPLVVMAPALISLAVVPFSEKLLGRDINVGLLLIFALGSINVMAIMLGGWSSRNKYAIISAARVVSQNVAYEIPTLLVVITMIMVTGSMDLNEIVRQQAGGFWRWNLFRWDVEPAGAGDLPDFLHLHAGGDQSRPVRHGGGGERVGGGGLHGVFGDGLWRVFHGGVREYPAGMQRGDGAVPGRVAKPGRDSVRVCSGSWRKCISWFFP